MIYYVKYKHASDNIIEMILLIHWTKEDDRDGDEESN